MQPEDCRNILQSPRLDEYLRPARSLLCGLEEDAHASRKLCLTLLEQQRCTEHRSDVKIVPTGVHTPCMLRAIP